MTNKHGPNRAKLSQSPEPNSPRDTAWTTRPERLWLWPECHDDGMDKAVSFPDQLYPSGSTEYIRADLATPAPVVPAEGLDALQRRAYSWQVEHEQGPDTFRDVRNNPAHAHEMLESAHVLIDDLASALRSAPPVGARVTGWQPIETTPKDGTPVDLWCLNLLHHAKKGFRKTNVSWGTVTDWFGTEREDWRHGHGEDIQPTHWMPLPEPPAALLPAGEGRVMGNNSILHELALAKAAFQLRAIEAVICAPAHGSKHDQNMQETAMTEAPKPTRTEPGEIAWYWGTSDDGDSPIYGRYATKAEAMYWGTSDDGDSPIYGRYATKAEAIDAWMADHGDDLRYDLEQEGEIPPPISDDTLREMCPLVARYRKPSISCEIFDADHILEEMEDRNEVAASADFPADPKPEIKRALERHMAEALFQFCEAHNLWDEFRGLEWMGDADDRT